VKVLVLYEGKEELSCRCLEPVCERINRTERVVLVLTYVQSSRQVWGFLPPEPERKKRQAKNRINDKGHPMVSL